MDKLKTIKAINQRLDVYEKQGLTESRYYKRMISTIRNLGLPTTQSKSGHVRISRSKLYMEDISVKDLERVSKLPSLKEERQKARKELKSKLGRKATQEEVSEHISQSGKLESWIEDHLDQVYVDMRLSDEKISNAATSIYKMLKDGLRKYDYSFIWSQIEQYEKIRESIKESESEYFENDEDEDASDGELFGWNG